MLTVVTAVHRNIAGLRNLAQDLVPFLSNTLRWHVKDSGACVEIAAWRAKLVNPYMTVDMTPDTGFYDALNRAIAQVRSDYYLVVGSDDRLYGRVLADVVAGLAGNACTDIVTFPVQTPRGLRRRARGLPLWLSSSSLTSSHSVGTLIRRSLHGRVGLYDTRYRILADSLFLRQAHDTGATFDHRDGPTLGVFLLDGVSSRDHGRRLTETYNYLVDRGSPRWLQACLLAMRLLRYRPETLL